jgi:hypothetical protein
MSAQQTGKERSQQSPSVPLTSPPPVSASTTTTYQSSSSSILSPPTTNQPQDPEAVRRTLEARTAFTASLHSVGQTVSADLLARATDLHENEAAIQKQENELARHTAELSRQNDQWDKVVDSARQGLKEIGDVQNWAEMIERDLLVVEEVLRQVEGHADHEDHEEGSYHEDNLHEEEEDEDGSLTEREDEDRKKVVQEPVDILDDVSSSASGITGTSATSGTMSESSGKSSPPDQDGGQQQVKASGDSGKKSAGGWWRWWW